MVISNLTKKKFEREFFLFALFLLLGLDYFPPSHLISALNSAVIQVRVFGRGVWGRSLDNALSPSSLCSHPLFPIPIWTLTSQTSTLAPSRSAPCLASAAAQYASGTWAQGPLSLSWIEQA